MGDQKREIDRRDQAGGVPSLRYFGSAACIRDFGFGFPATALRAFGFQGTQLYWGGEAAQYLPIGGQRAGQAARGRNRLRAVSPNLAWYRIHRSGPHFFVRVRTGDGRPARSEERRVGK